MTEIKYETLFEALGAVQSVIEQPKKDASNPMFKASYVTLDSVILALNKAIRKAEAKVFWYNEPRDGVMFTVVTGYGDRLEIAGAPIASDLGNRGTNSAQAEGSAETYARRYSLSMAFGIASDVDDDGNSASGQVKRQAPKQQAPAQPAKPKAIDYRSYMVKEAERFKKAYEVDDATMWELVNSNHDGLHAHDVDTALNADEKMKQAVIKWLKLQTDKREQELQGVSAT